jgi:nitrite reductase/ring-hydroxylating ferredoxin subunit/uncharacterized membrane protein
MRTTASFKGHPIHPMLVAFPIAFLAGGWGYRVAGAVSKRRDLTDVSQHLVPAGVAAGLLAAVPGLADYLGSVPPRSSARSRATKHALVNTAALTLFSTGWLLGRASRRTALPLILETMGLAAMTVGGWMGGTLVYRNQIGVDHRYAGAGRWQEETREHGHPPALSDAAASLDVNQMKLVHAGRGRIVVARSENGYAAFDDRCTHRGGPLSDGAIICGVVQCPWHGSQFDVKTGEVRCGPAETKIDTYEMDPVNRPVRSTA